MIMIPDYEIEIVSEIQTFDTVFGEREKNRNKKLS